MNFEYVDNVYRSRITLLDMLDGRGYNIDKYRKFSPAEISIAIDAFPSLSFKVSKRDDETKVCDVRYAKLSRQKLDTFFNDISDEEAPNTEVIVMMLEPIGDAHHMTSLKQYMLPVERNGDKDKRTVITTQKSLNIMPPFYTLAYIMKL